MVRYEYAYNDRDCILAKDKEQSAIYSTVASSLSIRWTNCIHD